MIGQCYIGNSINWQPRCIEHKKRKPLKITHHTRTSRIKFISKKKTIEAKNLVNIVFYKYCFFTVTKTFLNTTSTTTLFMLSPKEYHVGISSKCSCFNFSSMYELIELIWKRESILTQSCHKSSLSTLHLNP